MYLFDIFVLPPGIKLFGDGIETATLIITDMKQFESIEEAFVINFKKYLYHSEEWNDDYSNDIPKSEWMHYLQNYWIPEYFGASELANVPVNNFIDRFKNELIGLKLSNEHFTNLMIKLTNLKVTKFSEDLLSYDVFGVSDDLCFIYLWWIGY